MKNKQGIRGICRLFIIKITKIRKILAEHPQYIPVNTREIPPLDTFTELSQGDHEMKKIVLSMATKSCESDALPTKLLKDRLDRILPVLAKLTNVSLKHGTFPIN